MTRYRDDMVNNYADVLYNLLYQQSFFFWSKYEEKKKYIRIYIHIYA